MVIGGEGGFEFGGEPVDFRDGGVRVEFRVVEAGEEDSGAGEVAGGFGWFCEDFGEVAGDAVGVGLGGSAAEAGGAFFEGSGFAFCELAGQVDEHGMLKLT